MFSHHYGWNEPRNVRFREMAATDFGRFHVESLYGLLYRLNPIAKYPLLSKFDSELTQYPIEYSLSVRYSIYRIANTLAMSNWIASALGVSYEFLEKNWIATTQAIQLSIACSLAIVIIE